MTKSLMKKLLAVDKSAQILAESDMLDATPIIKSSVKMFNVTMGGTFDGGIGRGMHQFVGESKTFKTGFLMLMAKDFLDQNKTGVVLFFDSEAGGASIIHALRMDLKRIIHIPMIYRGIETWVRWVYFKCHNKIPHGAIKLRGIIFILRYYVCSPSYCSSCVVFSYIVS